MDGYTFLMQNCKSLDLVPIPNSLNIFGVQIRLGIESAYLASPAARTPHAHSRV